MWEEIFKTALEGSLWAVLCCVLLMYQLRDSRTRELKYRETISALVEKLGALDYVCRELDEALVLLKRKDKRKTAAQNASAVQVAECESEVSSV